MITEQKLVALVTKLVWFTAFAMYLVAVVQIGQISLDHPNFVAVKDANGQVVLEDGVAKQVANTPPVIPDTVAIINTTIGAALALNFGAIIGITVTKAGVQNPPNPLDPNAPQPGLWGPNNFVPAVGENKNLAERIIAQIGESLQGFMITVRGVASGMANLHVRYWGVIVYLISLALGIFFFYRDGGFNPDSGAIAVELKDFFLTAVGIAGGVMSNLQKPN